MGALVYYSVGTPVIEVEKSIVFQPNVAAL